MKKVYRTTLSNDESNQEHLAHSGQIVKAKPLDESLYDKRETGLMFEIEASDGWKAHAFADELSDN